MAHWCMDYIKWLTRYCHSEKIQVTVTVEKFTDGNFWVLEKHICFLISSFFLFKGLRVEIECVLPT